ncbi:hypothetical protein CAPTEDRAFT_62737, partial [Capitella teleta]
PMSKSGKKLQVLRMMGMTLIPISVLLLFVWGIFSLKIQDHVTTSHVRHSLDFSAKISSLIHTMQVERDAKALHAASIGGNTQWLLLQKYTSTDEAILALPYWPNGGGVPDRFQSKIRFSNFLNRHRFNLSQNHTIELDFYTTQINVFMKWFFDSITEVGSGTIWIHLVALQETLQCEEMLALERLYGLVYYLRGTFESTEDYLMFAKVQDVANATIQAAILYSSVAERMLDEIKQYQGNRTRQEIDRHRIAIRRNPFPENATGSVSKARSWFDKMSVYENNVFKLQKALLKQTETLMLHQETQDRRVLTGLGLVTCMVMLFCPLIMNAVYFLTDHMQKFSLTLVDRTKALDKEKRRTDALLHQMLPESVAEQLKTNHDLVAEEFAEATVFFSDIVGFTSLCADNSPIQTIEILDNLYCLFDDRIRLYDVHKVETIGDAYMVASGLPKRNGNRHAAEIACMSIDLLDRIHTVNIPYLMTKQIKLRIGFHTGRVVAGVVGSKMPRYCLFGDTVHYASSMEQSG